MTIPHDEGWKIEVNNNKVLAQRGGNTFLVIPMEAGDNNIKLHYQIPGFISGIIISIIFTVLILLDIKSISINLRKKQKKKFNK